MACIEVSFPVLGTTLPTDHAYPLLAALAGVVARLHEPGLPVGITTTGGQYTGNGVIALNTKSRLRIRLPAEEIAGVLPLAGKALELVGHRVRLGVPRVAALVPAASLVARMVTIKNATEPESFLAAVREKLSGMGITGEPAIPLITSGPRAGQPRRRVLRIKGKRVIGYSLQVTGLTAEDSLRLQEQSDSATAFSRRKLGCAFFVPLLPRWP
jgi:CRISPR-associated protein Cas6